MFFEDIYIFYFHILMVKTYGPGFGPLKKKKNSHMVRLFLTSSNNIQ